MAAQIPIKDDPVANDKAMESVRADKLREVRAGHDGTWVAHPALASIASEVFNKYMPTPNQLFVRRQDVNITANDLLNTNVPGKITEEGIRKNLNIGLSYMEGWLRGVGCIPINYLMVCLFTWTLTIFILANFRVGGCRYRRSVPVSALAVGAPPGHQLRGQEDRQGLRSASAPGAGRQPGRQVTQGQQVPAGGPLLCRSGDG
jgi:hypothetical protein